MTRIVVRGELRFRSCFPNDKAKEVFSASSLKVSGTAHKTRIGLVCGVNRILTKYVDSISM